MRTLGARRDEREFRGDIQGLRAVAVLLVLLWHGGLTVVSGGYVGVDVFFVISGYLITDMLLGEVRRERRLSLVGFYARRVKRLLPAAGTVLVAALVVTYFLLPRIRWSDTARDVVASSLYVVNWRFAEQATDYLARSEAASVVQHYWTLSVEEQFYLVWPLLLLVMARRARRRRWSATAIDVACLVAVAAVFVPSFVWSVVQSTADPERAYFVTTTRMWEFALGGALAVLVPRLARLPRPLGALVGWAGVAAVVWAALAYDSSTAFPGSAALAPTLGAAAIILGGTVSGRAGPASLLDTAPMRAVGALSYSLYLWHWVFLVGAEARFGPLSPSGSLAAVACSVVPAWLTYRYIENPIRYAEGFRIAPARALRMGLAVTLVPVVGALLCYQVLLPAPVDSGDPVARGAPGPSGRAGTGLAPAIGAAVLSDRPRRDPRGAPVDRSPTLAPDPLRVRDDVPSLYSEGCHQAEDERAAEACVYGAGDASTTVALVGDSHAAQWVPALQVVGKERGWRVASYTKSSCPLLRETIPIGTTLRPYRSCAEWNANVLATLVGPQRPDLVVTTSSHYHVLRDGALLDEEDRRSALVDGLRAAWRTLTDAGVAVVVLRDTPHPPADIGECVNANPERLTRCSFPRPAALDGIGSIQEEAAAGLADVHLVDLNDAICPTDQCAAVIGGVIVYRDTNHLTATYALSLGPRLDAALSAVVPPDAQPR